MTQRVRLLAVLLLGGVILTAFGWSRTRPSPVSWVGPAPAGVWASTGLTLQTNALAAPAAQPGQPAMLFAGTSDGVWRSGDGGRRWTPAGHGLRGTAILSLAPAATGDVLFAGSENGVVYAYSVQHIGSWQPVSPSLGGNPIFSLAASAGRSEMVLAGTVGALYRGVPDGQRWHWQRVASTGDSAVSAIVWFPSDAQSAMASVFGTSPPVLATHDGGRTWTASASGLPPALPTQALLAVGTRIILTTMGGGVWEQPASGPWREISAGLPERHAMPLVQLPDSVKTVLYAGTMGDGLYVKQGDAAWQPFGRGLTGVQNTVLSLGITAGSAGSPPALVAGTAFGVFRYLAPPQNR